jgi:hypothetical protein
MSETMCIFIYAVYRGKANDLACDYSAQDSYADPCICAFAFVRGCNSGSNSHKAYQVLPGWCVVQELMPSIDDEDIERQVRERMHRHRLKNMKRFSRMKS